MCFVIASTIWLQLHDGYRPTFINTDNIGLITERGLVYINTNGSTVYKILAWDEQQKRYLQGQDVIDLIRSCDIPKQ
jgi:hypothetical protein